MVLNKIALECTSGVDIDKFRIEEGGECLLLRGTCKHFSKKNCFLAGVPSLD